MIGQASRSAFSVDVARFLRSPSLWLLLLAAPIAARYMISETPGEGINMAVGGQLPVLTSPVFGIWLGIVVSLFIMPVAFIYLRAGPTRRQPWQVTETTRAGRVSIALGRFGANSLAMIGILAVLIIAGLFLAWLKVTGPWQPGIIIALAALVALPTLLATAAIHLLFDAVPALRGALGDFAFFVLWMATLIIPMLLTEAPSSYANNLASLSGAIRPLVDSAPPGSNSFAIGTSELSPGRIALDPWRGIMADGYIAARASWIALAVGIAIIAGLLYRPHKPKDRRDRFAFIRQMSLSRLLPHRAPSSDRAMRGRLAPVALVLTEMRLIAGQPLFPLLAIGAALAGLAPDYRHAGSGAALLLMVFALSSHAGQAETHSLRALTRIAALSPWFRRAAFIVAGTVLTAGMAIPAAIFTASLYPLTLGAMTGAAFSAMAIGLAALSGSAFLPRVLLLIIWYGYFAS